MPPHAPTPSHILRAHSSPVSVVFFSADNERLYSGDLSGTVVVTSTRSLRSVAAWKAHADGLLGVREWETNIITHGRDNKMHVWARVLAPQSVGDAATRPDLPAPILRYSLDVNALNFCRFSLLSLPLALSDTGGSSSTSTTVPSQTEKALITVPNLVESSLADVWELPSCKRIHAAIGKLEAPEAGLKGWQADGRGDSKTGILMSLHLFFKTFPSCSQRLHLLSAYESGEVVLRRYTSLDREVSVEGRGWECLWKTKQHVESVMAMAVTSDSSFALTVSADHLVVRYSLLDAQENLTDIIRRCTEGDTVDSGNETNWQGQFAKFKIKQRGNGAVALRDDGRVCAIGGWDGKIRLFSTKTFKSLGTLSYHGKSCQALAFAHSMSSTQGDDANDPANASKPMERETDEEDEDMTEEEEAERGRWLVAGAQDQRLSMWELMRFEAGHGRS